MAVPKKRTTPSKKRTRRSHHALQAPTLSPCPKCKTLGRPHNVCAKCGTYRGKKLVTK